ncbi:MAG: S24/S26 family peptidase [Prevotella sp.]|nr:S24/S26 family peptidase [Prevotella sp.]
MSQPSKPAMTLPNDVLLPKVVELIGKGHSVTLPLRGYSMRPFLEDGRDKAVLCRVDTGSLRRGDVVLAHLPTGKYVIHRIIEISCDNITLLGDGNLTPEHCRRSDILATATGFYRKDCQKSCGVSSVKWRVYSRLWMALRPLRRYLLAFHRRVVMPLSR